MATVRTKDVPFLDSFYNRTAGVPIVPSLSRYGIVFSPLHTVPPIVLIDQRIYSKHYIISDHACLFSPNLGGKCTVKECAGSYADGAYMTEYHLHVYADGTCNIGIGVPRGSKSFIYYAEDHREAPVAVFQIYESTAEAFPTRPELPYRKCLVRTKDNVNRGYLYTHVDAGLVSCYYVQEFREEEFDVTYWSRKDESITRPRSKVLYSRLTEICKGRRATNGDINGTLSAAFSDKGMECTLLPNDDIPSLLRETLLTDAFYTSIHERIQELFGPNVTKDDTDALFGTDEWTSQLLSAETIETALDTMSNILSGYDTKLVHTCTLDSGSSGAQTLTLEWVCSDEWPR